MAVIQFILIFILLLYMGISFRFQRSSGPLRPVIDFRQ
jgi:hypothetical protein